MADKTDRRPNISSSILKHFADTGHAVKFDEAFQAVYDATVSGSKRLCLPILSMTEIAAIEMLGCMVHESHTPRPYFLRGQKEVQVRLYHEVTEIQEISDGVHIQVRPTPISSESPHPRDCGFILFILPPPPPPTPIFLLTLFDFHSLDFNHSYPSLLSNAL